MGIRLLNTFLNAQNVNGIIKNEHFSMLKRKKICIDISIYLYKFKQLVAERIDLSSGEILDDPQKILLSEIKHMVNVLRKYYCEPIVVFDGKPPKEKEGTINERQQAKKVAQSKSETLKRMLKLRNDTLSVTDKIILCSKISDEIKKSISIVKSDIIAVKNLLDEMRVEYRQCEGEADHECVQMVKKGDVWAVVSDDTDFIAQCCRRVLRNVDFHKERYDFVNTQLVLISLYMSHYDFKCLCVLAGCDYYKLVTKVNIFKLYEYYCKYWKSLSGKGINKKHRNSKSSLDKKEQKDQTIFLTWLTQYISFNPEDVAAVIENNY